MNKNENRIDAISSQIDEIVLAERSYRPDGTLTNAAREKLRALSSRLDGDEEGQRSGAVVEFPRSSHKRGDPKRWTRPKPQR